MEELQPVKFNGVHYTPPYEKSAGSSTSEEPCKNLLVCRVCLATDCKLYKMTEHKVLCEAYKTLTELSVESESTFPLCVCSECSLQLLQSAQLRRTSLASQSILTEVLDLHGHITIESIKSYKTHKTNLNRNQNEINEDVVQLLERYSSDKEKSNKHCDMNEVISVDDIKVEHEIEDETGDSAGVDIASLQHDITVEMMKAERDDVIDGAIWSGLQVVEVQNSVVINDDDSEDIKYDLEESEIVIDENQSFGDSDSRDQVTTTRPGKKKGKRNSKTGRGPGDEVFCDKCSFKAKTVAGMMRHLQSHATKKTYNCTKCSYQTSKEIHLKRHSDNVHYGKKPYSCKICNNLFISKGNLEKHFRIHTGEKPYSCKVCSKSFSRSDHLKMHFRIHTGEKPYSCDVCDKSFRTNQILKFHLEFHSDKKSFSCHYCNKAFVRKYNLQVHLRTHSGDKPYSCNFCNRKFVYSFALKSHLKNDCNKNS